MTAELLREVADGIFRVDVRYPIVGRTCCYIVRHNGAAAIIDCGGKRGVGAVMDSLQTLGVTAESVEWLVPTHAHLDHSGAAGQLMQLLPKAVMAGHPNTIKHLVDPYKALVAAVRQLYGDKYYEEHYGELTPVDVARTHDLSDDEYIVVGGDRPLQVIYSPGHAWHHLSIVDKTASFLAAGDAYGISYRELDNDGKSSIVPVMPPSQFNPEAMADSIRRLRAADTAVVGLAHYDTPTIADDLAKQQLTALECWLKQANEFFAEGEDKFYQKMFDYLIDWAAENASARGADAKLAREKHQIDSHLSACGFTYYLKKLQDK